jgi:hypothetical protein
MEFAPAPAGLNDGDCVSHVALSAPPVVEQAVVALGGVVVAVCATGGAVVVGAAVVVVAPADAAVVDVVVEEFVVLSTFFFAAVGVELHAAATSATAAKQSIRVDHRGTGRRALPATAGRSAARRLSAPRCTGSPLGTREEARPPHA